MEITNQTINKLAILAKLKFSDFEKEEIKSDLKKMIGFINQLQNIDTSNVEPLQHISDTVNILREDKFVKSINKESALMNAPAKDEHFFKVPKVIKK